MSDDELRQRRAADIEGMVSGGGKGQEDTLLAECFIETGGFGAGDDDA